MSISEHVRHTNFQFFVLLCILLRIVCRYIVFGSTQILIFVWQSSVYDCCNILLSKSEGMLSHWGE
jgi:hypothetical protein